MPAEYQGCIRIAERVNVRMCEQTAGQTGTSAAGGCAGPRLECLARCMQMPSFRSQRELHMCETDKLRITRRQKLSGLVSGTRVGLEFTCSSLIQVRIFLFSTFLCSVKLSCAHCLVPPLSLRSSFPSSSAWRSLPIQVSQLTMRLTSIHTIRLQYSLDQGAEEKRPGAYLLERVDSLCL